MNRRAAAFLLGVLSACVASPAGAQPAIDGLAIGKRLWMQRQFSAAYEYLKQYREMPYGRSFEVDFMVGTCACRMPERRERGADFLEWVRYTYSKTLTDEGRAVVNAELESCRGPQLPAAVPAPLPAVGHMVTAGASLSGKIYTWVNQDSRTYVANYLATAVPLPEQRIRERWIAIGKGADALRLAQQALPGARVKAFSRFVIASSAGHTDAQLTETNRLLERYLAFFEQSYGMRPPTNYMFVYMVPGIGRLNEFAMQRHGLKLGYGTIAYSFRDDLSIAAVVPGRAYGSLFHELFHLGARSNFGDIPTWLDEGIAALYEESQAAAGGFRGTPNWRGEVLTHFKSQIPSVRALIEQRDLELDAQDRAIARSELAPELAAKQQAIFSATARYFALYLQERGALFATYRAVRDFSTSDDFTGTAEAVVRLVEQSVGRRIDAIDADFREWLPRQQANLGNLPDDELRTPKPPAR